MHAIGDFNVLYNTSYTWFSQNAVERFGIREI